MCKGACPFEIPMLTVLPSRVMNYRVSAASPTDELVTLGQILSEVGDYMSAILDRDHLSLSRRCATRLRKVVGELMARKRIESPDDLYEMPASAVAGEDPGAMTVSELHAHYRLWPMRHQEREAMGREHLTFCHEGRIVRELLTRKPADRSERLKIDYCLATYGNELENLSFILSLPLKADADNAYPDPGRDYSPEELVSLIRRHSSFRDIIGREILVEYVDIALDLLERDNQQPTTENRQRKTDNTLALLTELSELRRRQTIRIPAWVDRKLEEAVNSALASATTGDPGLPLAMLALEMVNGDSSLTDKATAMINRCYKRAFDESAGVGERIASLHTAVMCCDYVTRFSPLEAAACWNHLATLLLTPSPLTLDSSPLTLDSSPLTLLETARELESFAPISPESKEKLTQLVQTIARVDQTIEP